VDANEVLVCEECVAGERRRSPGLDALLAEDVNGLGPMSVAVFCPQCALVEFGYRAEDEGEAGG
jgi:hypothetical protein